MWEDEGPYCVKSFYGTDGAEYVSDYQEFYEYNEAGKPVCFRSTGVDEDRPTDEPFTVVHIDFLYRDNGTLWSKKYGHDALLFGTTYSPAYLYYDRRERVTRIDCYITHGSLEYFEMFEAAVTLGSGIVIYVYHIFTALVFLGISKPAGYTSGTRNFPEVLCVHSRNSGINTARICA